MTTGQYESNYINGKLVWYLIYQKQAIIGACADDSKILEFSQYKS